jgi:hypothetical protein
MPSGGRVPAIEHRPETPKFNLPPTVVSIRPNMPKVCEVNGLRAMTRQGAPANATHEVTPYVPPRKSFEFILSVDAC